jgi:hypothetical protein
MVVVLFVCLQRIVLVMVFLLFVCLQPNRTYYLESKNSDALDWEKQIAAVWQRYYGSQEDLHMGTGV